jgi:CubicO group peptidase (beta-lactamase class C family)
MKNTFCFVIGLLLFKVNFCYSVPESNNDILEYSKRLDNYFENLREHGFSGSILIENAGKVIRSAGFGFSNRELQIENNIHTVFDIGSVTKQFTTAAILKLEMQGKLSVDDSIFKIL